MDYQLIIDDYIGGWWGTNKRSIRDRLDQYKGKHVDAKISSLGGSLDDGLDIRQQFIDHGDVTAYLHGFVASAATVIAMGAKHIVMGKYALFLVHKCSNDVFVWDQMNADDLQRLIDDLTKNKEENDKIDRLLAAMYAARCKNHSQDELLELLKESKWLTAQEALDWGFIDEILDEDDDAQPVLDNSLAQKFNAMGLPTMGLEIQPDQPGGILRNILNVVQDLRALFNHSNEKTADNGTNVIIMEKEFKTVAALLKVDSLADNDGAVTLTAVQMQAIEDRLNDLEAQHTGDADIIAERDKTITALEEQVRNLQAAPADETSVVDEAEVKAPVNAKELYNNIKDLI